MSEPTDRCDVTGEWMTKRDWKVGHFVRADKRTLWMGCETGWSACGSCVSINEHLIPHEPVVDIKPRCSRCEGNLARG